MITAGVDIGSTTSKAVILQDGRILSYSLISTGADSPGSARKAVDLALEKTGGLGREDLQFTVATGYGRGIASLAGETVTEISCHARGANWLFPGARTILDMGGQDCKAIRCDGSGKLLNFAMNDKCAAGTGRFLEVMVRVMDLPLESMGELSLKAWEDVKIDSICAVFAKSEVTALLRRGIDKASVLGGLHSAISSRVHNLLRRVGVEPEFVITGGIAKNIGVVKRMEEKVGLKALIPGEPQIVGALGAALFACDRLES